MPDISSAPGRDDHGDRPSNPTAKATHGAAGRPAGAAAQATWRIPLIVSVVLIGTSIAGFALTNYAPERASWYWVLILPAFAAVPIWHTWTTIRRDGKTNWPIMRKQIYHWIALLVAMHVSSCSFIPATFRGRGGSLVALLLMALDLHPWA